MKKTKVYFNQRGDKWVEIARSQFSKITETACLSGWEFEASEVSVIFEKLPFVI